MNEKATFFRLKKTDSERAVFLCLFSFPESNRNSISKSSAKKLCSTEGIQLKKSQQFH